MISRKPTSRGKWQLALCLSLCSSASWSLAASATTQSGGETTVYDQGRNAFTHPAANLSFLRQEDFFIGSAFFKKPWVSSPASTTARDGLGPLFNARTCLACHARNGRSQPSMQREQQTVLPLTANLSIQLGNGKSLSKTDLATLQQFGSLPEPNYGHQLQPDSVGGVQAEGKLSLRYRTIQGQYADGEAWRLQQPQWQLTELSYGDLHPDTQLSVRVAPALIGMGLLAAIPHSHLAQAADPQDQDGDGISGRFNQVWNHHTQEIVPGRFGWKANQADLVHQTASAFHNDLGISSTLFPQQNCSHTQTTCQQAPDGGQPEITGAILDKVLFYLKTLGVPARRDTDDPEVLHGERLFKRAGCAACHTPVQHTGDVPGLPELSQQTIQPFTDLLLHDMGSGLADHRTDFAASGQEWRTPPLWGIGLLETVNGHTRLLHDGRARNVAEAILWHGGEAGAARDQFIQMTADERAALVRFINSL